MKIRRRISIFFVQLAMAVFLLHAIVPHCHHADGQVMFFFHHYICMDADCEHQHEDEACGERLFHHCHHHHHAGDHDEDCVLNKPFIKGDNKVHLESTGMFTLACFAADAEMHHHLVDNRTFFVHAYPTLDVVPHDCRHLSAAGLRAPPIL